MPRQTMTKNYINDDEVNRQIGELVDTTATEHWGEIAVNQQKQYYELSDRHDAGELTNEEAKEIALMHKINASFSHTPHEQRWAEQNAIALEAKKVADRMDALGDKYRAKAIDEATYYERWGKLKAKQQELEGQL